MFYYFAVDMQVYEVEIFTYVSHVAIIELYERIRHHISRFLQKDPVSLGNSEGSIVEIGESLFGKKKVQVGKDQEKAQSEKDSHSKSQGGKKPN